MEQSIARQRSALEQQRAAVRVQVRGSHDAPGSFFTVPWIGQEAPPPVRPPECDPVPEERIGPIVEEISEREGLTPDLLHAVIEKESAYLPCAVSASGAQGLMQLMPVTAAELGVEDPFDARQNVDGGARFLRQLLDRYGGNLVLALAAYNAGPRRVDSAGGVPPIPETMGYVSGILDRLGED
jgi:soluble lytic murein transglycosylase-like protein